MKQKLILSIVGYLDKVIKPLVLILPEISGYVKTFKVKDRDKTKNNKMMPFRIKDEKLLKKHKSIWTKIKDLKNIWLIALPVYNDRYIKTKIKTYGDKVYINFRGLNVPGDDIECKSVTVISIDCLLVYENKILL